MKKGFTLIELLVVVLIIGILSAIALPQYQKAVDRTRATQLYAIADEMIRAQREYYLANSEWTSDINKLDFGYEVFDCKNQYCMITGKYRIEWGTNEWTARWEPSSEFSVGLYGMNGRLVECIASWNDRADAVCKLLTGKSAPEGSKEKFNFYKF